MFEELMGNLQEQQKRMKQLLATKTVQGTSPDGAVTVTANGNREIVNISIDANKLDWNDKEQVEELTMIAVNNALRLATELESSEAQNMVQNMMPPGMGGLGNLFS